jgi:hypothetical protein
VTETLNDEIKNLDNAFQWLILLLSILIGVMFQFLTWIGGTTNVHDITKIMVSITIPLFITILSWVYQLILSNIERKMILRLFSWTLANLVLMYYMMLFAICILVGEAEIPSSVGVVMLVLVVVLGTTIIPQGIITIKYKNYSLNLRIWQRGIFQLGIILLGFAIGSVMILLPLLFF